MLKNIETETVFTNTDMNNEWNIFFKIVLLVFNTLIPASFTLIEISQNHFFWYGVFHMFKPLTLEKNYLEETWKFEKHTQPWTNTIKNAFWGERWSYTKFHQDWHIGLESPWLTSKLTNERYIYIYIYIYII